MGLSYLNKKVWHPGRMQNMEQVWLAEEKQKKLEKTKKENLKKLKEEQHIEHLKQLQAQSGLISQSAVEKMSWMYDWGHKVQQEKNVEDFLLGKQITEKDMQNQQQYQQQQIQQIYKEEIGNDKNEAFTLLHEDPLYLIQQMERKKRQEIINNPIQMNDIYSKIEEMTSNKQKLSEKEKKKLAKKEKKRLKKERKREKKEKKRKEKEENLQKKQKKDSSDISSLSQSSKKSNTSRSSSLLSNNTAEDNKHKKKKFSNDRSSKQHYSKKNKSQSRSRSASEHKKKKKKSKNHHSRSRSKSKSNEKSQQNQQKQQQSSKHSQLYDQYLKQRLGSIMTEDKDGKIKYDFSINKKKFNTSQIRKDHLSAEERVKMIQKMQEDAQNVQKQKLEQYQKDFEPEEEGEKEQEGQQKQHHKKQEKYDPKFLHSMKNKIYEGKNQEDLADRLGRKRNQVSRKLDKDQLKK